MEFFKANCHARFGSCADIVSYLCNFETKWHQILDVSLRFIDKVSCRKKFIKADSISSKQARL